MRIAPVIGAGSHVSEMEGKISSGIDSSRGGEREGGRLPLTSTWVPGEMERSRPKRVRRLGFPRYLVRQ